MLACMNSQGKRSLKLAVRAVLDSTDDIRDCPTCQVDSVSLANDLHTSMHMAIRHGASNKQYIGSK